MASCDPKVRRFAIVFGIILTRRSEYQPRQVSMTRLRGLWLEHLGKNKRIPSEMKVSNFVLTSDFTGDISWASWTHAQHHISLNGHFSCIITTRLMLYLLSICMIQNVVRCAAQFLEYFLVAVENVAQSIYSFSASEPKLT